MMSRAPTIADPRGAELETMLRRLGPRDELVYRRALFGLSAHCRGDSLGRRRRPHAEDAAPGAAAAAQALRHVINRGSIAVGSSEGRGVEAALMPAGETGRDQRMPAAGGFAERQAGTTWREAQGARGRGAV